MNNYIINPSVFYWINVLSIIQTALATFGITLALCGLILAGIYLYKVYDTDKPEEPEDKRNEYAVEHYNSAMKRYDNEMKHIKTIRKWMIASCVVGIILIVASVFVPSKQTSVEMLVARTATFENVNWTVQQVKEIVDYITSALKSAT